MTEPSSENGPIPGCGSAANYPAPPAPLNVPPPPESDARKRYWCRDDAALDRAAEHGCLGEDVSDGEPTVCGICIDSKRAITPVRDNGLAGVECVEHGKDCDGSTSDCEPSASPEVRCMDCGHVGPSSEGDCDRCGGPAHPSSPPEPPTSEGATTAP